MNGWRIVSLFSGIGGLESGLEDSGLGRVVAQVEQDDYCQGVLRRHWPEARLFNDVRTVTAEDLGSAEVVCGGFPCQDLSWAGRGAGIEGERSGLWSEFARIIGELRPQVVVVENVPALLHRGMGQVLGDLAALGYDAEWDCIPAAAVGAPHLRDRVFIVAYPHSSRYLHGAAPIFPTETRFPAQREPVSSGPFVPDADGDGQQTAQALRLEGAGPSWGSGSGRLWPPEPRVGRVANGLPTDVVRARIKCLGNAVVRTVASYVGGLIVSAIQRNAGEGGQA